MKQIDPANAMSRKILWKNSMKVLEQPMARSSRFCTKSDPRFGQTWLTTTGHSQVQPCSLQSLPRDNMAVVSSSNCTVTQYEDHAHKLALLHSSGPFHWLSPRLWRDLDLLRVSNLYLTYAWKLQSRSRSVSLPTWLKRVLALPKLRQQRRMCLLTPF